MRLSRQSIRTRIIALLAVPLLALVGTWVFATVQTVGPVLTLLDSQTRFENGTRPATVLVEELQAERRAAVSHLSAPNPTPLHAQFVATDYAIIDLRDAADTEEFRRAAGPASARLDELLALLDAVSDNRTQIVEQNQSRSAASGLYSQTIDVAYTFLSALSVGADPELSVETLAVLEVGRERELIAQMDAILIGAHLGEAFEPGEIPQLYQLIGARRAHSDSVAATLPRTVSDEYIEIADSQSMTTLRYLEDWLLTEARPRQPVPIDLVSWRDSQIEVRELLRDLELDAGEALAERAAPIAWRTIGQMLLVGILGMAIVAATLIASFRMGRTLIQRLTTLRRSAQELAHHRLPDVVSRLRRGERVDVATESPGLNLGPDEIGEVGRAFTEVQHTAVSAAVEEAKLRQGLNEVFMNIARRSQTLLHRQLDLLDQLERRTHEPSDLEQLFKLDHMTTRMRRHAENLVILAGGAPGRGWRNPVPVVDVIRGAVSEVEDYARVNVLAATEAAVIGKAVGDLIHLLAELIENATSFSPPHTEVRVDAQVVPNGLVVEIEDRGLGLSEEALREANAALASPPRFDPSSSERLGLLVVAQIASRLDVQVVLRSSPYGGVTAVVLIAPELIVEKAPPLSETSEAVEDYRAAITAPPLAALTAAPALVTSPPLPAVTERPSPPATVVEDAAGDDLPRRVSTRRRAAATSDGTGDPVPAAAPAAAPGREVPLSPADEVRARLSSYQQGLARGRAEVVDTTEREPRGQGN